MNAPMRSVFIAVVAFAAVAMTTAPTDAAVVVYSQPVVSFEPIYDAPALADNFAAASDFELTDVRVWGGYARGITPPASERFSVSVFEDDGGGLPREIPLFSSSPLLALRTRTSFVTGPGGVVFQYDLALPGAVPLHADTTYYLLVHDPNGVWNWSGAGLGGFFLRPNPDAPWARSVGNNHNLAFELISVPEPVATAAIVLAAAAPLLSRRR